MATIRPPHFGNPELELRQALEQCVVVDRSNLTRLLALGPDILDLLHRLSTADLKGLTAGAGRPTVITSSKGRIVEHLFVNALGDEGVLLTGGPDAAESTLSHLKRFTFAEDTRLGDIGPSTSTLALIGPRAADALAAADLTPPDPLGSLSTDFEGHPLWLLGHDGVSSSGFSAVLPSETAGSMWDRLVSAVGRVGGGPAGETADESRRVLLGQPARGHELTDGHNPLEAGLWDAVSFEKGCYVGQEVVARLKNYDKVSRTILGLLPAVGTAPPELGADLFSGGRVVGRVTSVNLPPGQDRAVALAYIKTRSAAAGDDVQTGSAEGPDARLVTLPFDLSSL